MSEEHPILPADPGAAYRAHRNAIDEAIRVVLERGRYVLGEEVAAFEEAFADYVGVACSVGVGTGTDAICLALRACGIGPGDAVLTVSHTAVATVAGIRLSGARPVFVDIDPQTLVMDPQRLAATIEWFQHGSRDSRGLRLKAVVPVHLYGHPADMPAIMDVTSAAGLYVIEDCAQAHGSSLRGRKTGSWGHLGAFSFYPTKNLGALGDAGAVVTNDPHLAERVRRLREYGWRRRYVSETNGTNSRLDELQAAVLRVKLASLDRDNGRRRELGAVYRRRLAATSLILPHAEPDAYHVYHQYVIRSARRDDLKSCLQRHAVGTLIHYPVPIHLQPAYRGRALVGANGLPVTEAVCAEILSLPVHPALTDSDVHRVCDRICEWQAGLWVE